jgi:uncharacterized protein
MAQHGMEELEFEWGDTKAASNIDKHKITFLLAKEVFWDRHVIMLPAKLGKNGEERRMAIGRVKGIKPTITVIYTMRNNGATIRLISARTARPNEWRAYDNNKMQIR